MHKQLVIVLVVEQDVGALDVAVEEVARVTEEQSFQQLLHERRNVALAQRHQTRLEQTHQVVVHVLKDQVEGTCHRDKPGPSRSWSMYSKTR